MKSRLRYIKGRLKQTLPELRGAFVGVARKASWSRIILSLAVVALMVIGISFLVVKKTFTARNESVVPAPVVATQTDRHPLTGLSLSAPLLSRPQVFAVMVENSYEAWPLSGLDQAFLVIEAPVEGGIPRFIAFFEEASESKKIGPVRSARPYYLDWADEFSSIYAHVGGSPEALNLINTNDTTRDFDQFFQSEYFWRDTVGRFAPHNVYTSTDLLMSSLQELGRSTKEYLPWLFADGRASGENISPTIDWGSGSTYDVTWKYETQTNSYARFQGTVQMKMTAGAVITANNVIVLESEVAVVDALGRRHIRTVGEGRALLYQNGAKIVATWKKPTRTDRLRFYSADGQELMMNAGKTWIEVTGDLKSVSESEPVAPVLSVTGQE